MKSFQGEKIWQINIQDNKKSKILKRLERSIEQWLIIMIIYARLRLKTKPLLSR